MKLLLGALLIVFLLIEIKGSSLVQGSKPEEKKVEMNPAIKVGRLAVEIHPLWTAKGGSFK